MAETTKKKGKPANLLVWILLGLLFVGLAGFGIGGFSGNVRSIGKVGDREVSVQLYANQLQGELRALSAQMGTNVTFGQARAFGLDMAVLDRVTTAAALDHEAARLGISVSDETVRAEITANPAFRGLSGQFDRQAYEFALSNAGFTPAQYDAILRDENARGLLEVAVISGVAPQSAFARALLDHAGEARSIEWARLDPELVAAGIAEPGEESLRAFHGANTELFTLPERRDISYVWLKAEMLMEGIAPDEAELREAYEMRIAEFRQPERLLLERLGFATAENAAAALAEIEAGDKDFDDIVEERRLGADDVDMGEVTRERLPAEAAEALFGRGETGVFGPLPSPLGPALYRVNAVLSATEVSFEDAREELVTDAVLERARRMVADTREDIDDLLAGGASLEEVAAETPAELGRLALYADSTEEIAGHEAFRAAAAGLRADDFPELIELSDGSLAALRLEGTIAPELQPFEEVRDEVELAWRRAEELGRLRSLAASYQARLAGGESFADTGLMASAAEGLTRDGVAEGLPRGAVARAFATEPGESFTVEGDTGLYIVRVTAITPFDPEAGENAQILAQVAGQVGRAVAQDMFDLFAEAVKTEAGVRLNQAAINAVHANFP